MTKYIFVTGGVVSSVGKGLTAASIGMLLEKGGLKISMQKIDPYLNVDPGTMSPFQHGEVYVTEDGAETDLDLGHYERFTDAKLTKYSSVTTGQIYNSVITKERRGDYLGATVQVIPHITNEIKDAIRRGTTQDTDIAICEIGGTVGDIEGLPFLEAIRQFSRDIGRENCLFIHVTLLPYLKVSGEIKTKPTQHSVIALREIGIFPDIIMTRSKRALTKEVRDKISLFCNVEAHAVIEQRDVQTSIYEVPAVLYKQKVDELVAEKLRIRKYARPNIKAYLRMLQSLKHPKHSTNIAIVGKYTALKDAYKSIYEALAHAGIENNAKLNIQMVASKDIEKKGDLRDRSKSMSFARKLKKFNGILVPGGFGERGIEGKVKAVEFARKNNIPFLGLCLGMHCVAIEFARNVLGLKNANSTEFDKRTPHPVISLLEEQKGIKNKGGTMRLGAYPAKLTKGTLAHKAYKKDLVHERHRHRYEFNNSYKDEFLKNGMVISGIYQKKNLAEIIELKKHRWFVATQFHPEFKSKPLNCHPLFRDFIKATLKR